MANEYQKPQRSSFSALSCFRAISRPFHPRSIPTTSTWATASTTTAKRKLSSASSFTKMSPFTSADSSIATTPAESPASSTSSTSDVLNAALKLDKLDITAQALVKALSFDDESLSPLDQEIPSLIKTAETDSCAENVLNNQNSTIAFAFDIDGVLVRSKDALPGAAQTLRMLQRRKIPFILLTNGGGCTEKDHVALLGRRLGVSGLSERQFVQSHTPYLTLVPSLANKNILVLGGTGSKIRDVAHAYGFKNVIIPSDLVKDDGNVYPFLEYTKHHHEEHGKEVKRCEEGRVQIHAILVWSSPRDWGILGTRSEHNGNPNLPNNGYLQDSQPPLYFCNPDLTWATAYAFPRNAQGLFKASFEGAWKAVTNDASLEGHVKVFGKPTEETFVFGERALWDWHAEINGPPFTPTTSASKENEKMEVNRLTSDSHENGGNYLKGEGGGGPKSTPKSIHPIKPIRTIYMIGDNPDSDIAGSKSFQSRYGSTWKSVLVESGVYVKGTVPKYEPSFFAEGVREAVGLALGVEGYDVEGEEKGEWGEGDEEGLVIRDNTENFSQG